MVTPNGTNGINGFGGFDDERETLLHTALSVSYTHLTLPTIA